MMPLSLDASMIPFMSSLLATGVVFLLARAAYYSGLLSLAVDCNLTTFLFFFLTVFFLPLCYFAIEVVSTSWYFF